VVYDGSSIIPTATGPPRFVFDPTAVGEIPFNGTTETRVEAVVKEFRVRKGIE
jgi:hypothetical protein